MHFAQLHGIIEAQVEPAGKLAPRAPCAGSTQSRPRLQLFAGLVPRGPRCGHNAEHVEQTEVVDQVVGVRSHHRYTGGIDINRAIKSCAM